MYTQKYPLALLTSCNTQVPKSESEKTVSGGRHLSRSDTFVSSKKNSPYISMVRDTMFSRVVKKIKLPVYSISIKEVDHLLNLLSLKHGDPEEKLVTLTELILWNILSFCICSSPRKRIFRPHTVPLIIPSPSWMASNLLLCLFTACSKRILSLC